jgi:hypothetical protein
LKRVLSAYSLRHTFGTRLGEAGADAFTIIKIMEHSSVAVSQRYVHLAPETLERAFERLEERNRTAASRLGERNEKQTVELPRDEIRQLPATVSATVSEGEVEASFSEVA